MTNDLFSYHFILILITNRLFKAQRPFPYNKCNLPSLFQNVLKLPHFRLYFLTGSFLGYNEIWYIHIL